jgi:hypothetical protein
MNRDQLIDILITAGQRFFRSLCADWMRTRVIDGRGNFVNDETGLT